MCRGLWSDVNGPNPIFACRILKMDSAANFNISWPLSRGGLRIGWLTGGTSSLFIFSGIFRSVKDESFRFKVWSECSILLCYQALSSMGQAVINFSGSGDRIMENMCLRNKATLIDIVVSHNWSCCRRFLKQYLKQYMLDLGFLWKHRKLSVSPLIIVLMMFTNRFTWGILWCFQENFAWRSVNANLDVWSFEIC